LDVVDRNGCRDGNDKLAAADVSSNVFQNDRNDSRFDCLYINVKVF
jgi:hypothetical protein